MRSTILQTATQYLLPVLVLYSVFLLLDGHHNPGGGFIGGLVAAAAVALCALAFDVPRARRVLPLAPHRFLGLGLLAIAVSGFLGLVHGRPFLTGIWWELPLPHSTWNVGSPLLFDVGVYLAVVGVVLLILFTLAER